MLIRLLSVMILLFANIAFAVSEADLEANFGVDKQYQNLGDAKAYALYGGELLSENYNSLSELRGQLEHQIEEENLDAALSSVEAMRLIVAEHEVRKDELNAEMQSIFQNFINPQIIEASNGTDRQLFRDIASRFEPLYQITFIHFHSINRRLDGITRHIMILKDVKDLGMKIQPGSKQRVVEKINEAFTQITQKSTDLKNGLALIEL